MLDLLNREVVGGSLTPRMTPDRVTDALILGWFRRKPALGLMHPSDRGEPVREPGAPDQTGRVRQGLLDEPQGHCWDNAPTESGFNRFKNARCFGERFATRDAMTATAVESIEVLDNRKHLHSTLGDRSPAGFLKGWINTREEEQQVV